MFSDKGKLENSLLIIQTASVIESENDFQPLNDKDLPPRENRVTLSPYDGSYPSAPW
jgi:hypothetical protein